MIKDEGREGQEEECLRDPPRSKAGLGQSSQGGRQERYSCQRQKQPGWSIPGRPQVETTQVGPPGLCPRKPQTLPDPQMWRGQDSHPLQAWSPRLPAGVPSRALLSGSLEGKACVFSKSQQHTQHQLGAKCSERRPVTASPGTATPSGRLRMGDTQPSSLRNNNK